MIASLPALVTELPSSLAPLHVLTLTPFYPSDRNEIRGCFVSEPLQHTEQWEIQNTVFAVQPFYRERVKATEAASAHWIRFISLPFNFGLASAGALLFAQVLRKVRELHHLNPIDVIHAHGALPCGHAARLLSRKLNIPFVVTVHGLDAFSSTQVSGIAGVWARRESLSVYHAAGKVICVSKKVRESVAAGTSISFRTTVIHNGVDLNLFTPRRGHSSETILSVGNLIPTKGHALLLRAFSKISARFPQLTLDIIGEGPELESLGRMAKELEVADRIRFLGQKSRREVAQAMNRCTIFALASSYEGLGCVYLEAMASGKPVIGCKGQGLEDAVQHGTNGWLVEPGNLEGLTNALSLLLTKPQLRRELEIAAHRTVVQDFTLEHQAAELNRVYRECAA